MNCAYTCKYLLYSHLKKDTQIYLLKQITPLIALQYLCPLIQKGKCEEIESVYYLLIIESEF